MLAMMCVRSAIALGDEHLNRLSEQFRAVVPEQPFGLRVDQRHPPARIDDHDRVGGGFQKPLQ
jgi:hypothetical protein